MEIPSPELCCLLASGLVRPGKALDLGAGAGTEAVWLARQGFDVTAVDVSARAVVLTRERAARHKVHVTTVNASATETGLPEESFVLINDRSCFHILRPELWPRYAREVTRLLRSDGLLLLRGFGDRVGGPTGMSREKFDQIFAGLLEPVGPIQEFYGRSLPNIPKRVAILRKPDVKRE
jgi:SAM-dependent methyltransferase